MARLAFVTNLLGLDGTAESGGLIASTIRGTTTPTPIFAESTGSSTLTNPAVGDALGQITGYLDEAVEYTLTAKTADSSVTLFTADVIAGVISLTWVNPEMADHPIIHVSWVPVLQAAIGSNWGTALGAALGDGWAALLGQDVIRVGGVVATYAALTALTTNTGRRNGAVYFVRGRASDNDGGSGYFLYSSASGATANGGTILTPDDSTGRYIRLHDGKLRPAWFGSMSSAPAASISAAILATPSYGTVVVDAADLTLSDASIVITSAKSFITIDMSGCKLRQRYSGGPMFDIGDGTTLAQGVSIIGDGSWIDGGTSANHSQPVFKTRGVRGLRVRGFYGSSIYQLHVWGTPGDSATTFMWYHDNCDWYGRAQSDGGGAARFIDANGSAGGYFENGVEIELDESNSTPQSVFGLTSAQGPARFDYFRSQNTIWSSGTYGMRALDARIVNAAWSANSRMDEMLEKDISIERTSGGSKGGCEAFRVHGAYMAGFEFLHDAASGDGFNAITIDVSCSGSKNVSPTTVKTPLVARSNAGANMTAFHVTRLQVDDYAPRDSSQYVVSLTGAVFGSIANVKARNRSGAAYIPDYGIHNNTNSTAGMMIEQSCTFDACTTAKIYDPNAGDLSINRHCKLHTDGTPRGKWTARFVVANASASATNALFGTEAGTTVASRFTAPARSRVYRVAITGNGTIAAGTFTASLSTGGAVDTNFDASFTSADGADPEAVVKYTAGSAVYAEADAVQARYTTDGSYSPTTCDWTLEVEGVEL